MPLKLGKIGAGGGGLIVITFEGSKFFNSEKKRGAKWVEGQFDEITSATGQAMAEAARKKMQSYLARGTDFGATGAAADNLYVKQMGSIREHKMGWGVVEGNKTFANRKMRTGLQPGTWPSKEAILQWAKSKPVMLKADDGLDGEGKPKQKDLMKKIRGYTRKDPRTGKTVTVASYAQVRKEAQEEDIDTVIYAIQRKIWAFGSHHGQANWNLKSPWPGPGSGRFDYPAWTMRNLQDDQFQTLVNKMGSLVRQAVINYITAGHKKSGRMTVLNQ